MAPEDLKRWERECDKRYAQYEHARNIRRIDQAGVAKAKADYYAALDTPPPSLKNKR